MRIKKSHVRKLPDFYQAQIENSFAVAVADMEQALGNAPLSEKRAEGFASPVCIAVHSIRKRLADPDGISFKAVLDGIVKAKVLPNDTTEFVSEVRFSQEKGFPETTAITIEGQ